MILKRWAAALLAAAGLAIISAAPSHAQGAVTPDDAEWAELSCIYTALMEVDDDAYYTVVDAYITEATTGDLFEAAASVITDAATACADQYGWTDAQMDAALTMGVAGTVADAIESWFLDEGYSDEEIDAIIGLVELISDEDVLTFLSDDWRRDEAFLASIETQLQGAGLDDDSGMMDMGLLLLETYLIGMYQSERWVTLADG